VPERALYLIDCGELGTEVGVVDATAMVTFSFESRRDNDGTV
jgi:hypothetical protein